MGFQVSSNVTPRVEPDWSVESEDEKAPTIILGLLWELESKTVARTTEPLHLNNVPDHANIRLKALNSFASRQK
jgi:hypothetical protein